MAAYARTLTAGDGGAHQQLRHSLIRALREDVTPRQREVLLLYYGQQLTMEEIGRRLGVDKSTVCRTVHRGERRLQRCLRYGAAALLDAAR
ncbi:sigma-70 family RNA polymerase sigma factor [Pseudoflavonifractor sp. 524-17]|nr:sigma-70 family RNA polymerase sigma factor [Pseudoflavonifractor sp. 524-17]